MKISLSTQHDMVRFFMKTSAPRLLAKSQQKGRDDEAQSKNSKCTHSLSISKREERKATESLFFY